MPSPREALSAASAGIVVVSKEYAYAIPGKLFEILDASRPVILIASRECDAAQLVINHGLGWVHEPEDIHGLAESVTRVMEAIVPSPVGLEDLEAANVVAALDGRLRALLADDKAGVSGRQRRAARGAQGVSPG